MISKLDDKLNPNLLYHNSTHTLDVIEQIGNIAHYEGITDPLDWFILRIAALFHDTGFLFVYNLHEEKSCEIMREELAPYIEDQGVLDRIANLIMMTKLPPDPVGHLERIICDADLDYLGRDDFFEISTSLKNEFINYGIVSNEREWQERQIKFLENHHYFTTSSQERRAPKKAEILNLLRKSFESENTAR